MEILGRTVDTGVLSFLRGLRDAGVPAWQRLQAARAVKSKQGSSNVSGTSL